MRGRRLSHSEAAGMMAIDSRSFSEAAKIQNGWWQELVFHLGGICRWSAVAADASKLMPFGIRASKMQLRLRSTIAHVQSVGL